MRAGSPRHTLMPTSGPTTNAIAAFNRPKEAQAAQTDGKGTNLALIKLNFKPHRHKLHTKEPHTNLNLLNLALFTLMFMIHAVINFTLKKLALMNLTLINPHSNKLYV